MHQVSPWAAGSLPTVDRRCSTRCGAAWTAAGGELWYSADRGDTWDVLSNPPLRSSHGRWRLVAHGEEPGFLLTWREEDTGFGMRVSREMAVSRNGGVSWSKVGLLPGTHSMIPFLYPTNSLDRHHSLQRGREDVCHIARKGRRGGRSPGIYASEDGRKTWEWRADQRQPGFFAAPVFETLLIGGRDGEAILGVYGTTGLGYNRPEAELGRG